MEKMNQVSVSEFFAKSKEEMYDMAVEMVEKYNRLVDICNDSAERIAELIERHKVYTSALNKDIASKDAKIEKLEKEIEGRKECYTALKELMDTKYISIDEHNKINKSYEEKIRHQRENLDGINKTLEIRTKEKERLIDVKNSQEKEIEAHEEENARLSEKITSLKGTITELSHEIDNYKSWNASLHKDIKSEINNKNDLVDAYEKKYDEFEKKIAELERQNKYLTKELDESYKAWDTDLKNHQKRDMTLVDELGKKNDKIKSLVQEIEYYKNQERIRTDQLRATESKVEELYKQIEGLTNNCRSKSTEIARLTKEMADIKHERNKEDDHGRAGFEEYIKYIIEEEERAVPERFKERLNKEITEIFTKEEETEVKGNGIPCGKDSIE